MRRMLLVLLTAVVAGVLPGCGEDQPNAAAQPSEVNADFTKKTVDMMKAANAGMDPKNARKPAAAPKQ